MSIPNIDVPDNDKIPLSGGTVLVGGIPLSVAKVHYEISENKLKVQRPGDPYYVHKKNPWDLPLFATGAGLTVHGLMKDKGGKTDVSDSTDTESSN